MESNLYHKIEKFINDEWIKLDQNQITPWISMTAGPAFHCKTFYGKDINYQVDEYNGSLQHVFWNRYIEPFIEDIVARAIEYTVTLCKKKNQSSKAPLNEVEKLLKSLSVKTYERMADIDQRLRGKGNPQFVKKRDTFSEQSAMEDLITKAVAKEKNMIKKMLWIREFYSNYPFIFWFIALAVGIAVTLLAS